MSNRPKKILIIIVSLVLLITAGGIWFYQNRRYPPVKVKKVLIDRHLTEDQKKFYLGRVAQAEKVLKTLNPSLPGYKLEQANTYLYIGQQYFGLGQISLAETNFNKALSLDPQNQNIFSALSLAQIEEGDYLAARLSLEKSIKLLPSSADTWLRFITLVKDRFPENRQEVDGYYEQALKDTDRHTDILSAYAQYLEAVGDKNKALELWKEASRKAPGNSLYEQEYKRLGGK